MAGVEGAVVRMQICCSIDAFESLNFLWIGWNVRCFFGMGWESCDLISVVDLIMVVRKFLVVPTIYRDDRRTGRFSMKGSLVLNSWMPFFFLWNAKQLKINFQFKFLSKHAFLWIDDFQSLEGQWLKLLLFKLWKCCENSVNTKSFGRLSTWRNEIESSEYTGSFKEKYRPSSSFLFEIGSRTAGIGLIYSRMGHILHIFQPMTSTSYRKRVTTP